LIQIKRDEIRLKAYKTTKLKLYEANNTKIHWGWISQTKLKTKIYTIYF